MSDARKDVLQGLAICAFVLVCGVVGWYKYYWGEFATYHECRAALAQIQYESGHHGETCFKTRSGRFEIDEPEPDPITP
jgi:hypothetical protein